MWKLTSRLLQLCNSESSKKPLFVHIHDKDPRVEFQVMHPNSTCDTKAQFGWLVFGSVSSNSFLP